MNRTDGSTNRRSLYAVNNRTGRRPLYAGDSRAGRRLLYAVNGRAGRRTLYAFIFIIALIDVCVIFFGIVKPKIISASGGTASREGIYAGQGGMLKFDVPVNVADIDDTRWLNLVNRDNPIFAKTNFLLSDAGIAFPKAGFLSADATNLCAAAAILPIVRAWPAAQVKSADITLHEAALRAVAGLFAAARESRAGNFYISSGYRDYEAQKLIYEKSPDKSYAQPPDHSEHQLGLAADIFAIGVLQQDFADSEEGRWLAANAWKHGLILRYPPDKQEETGIAHEPWHFRYVGQPHAMRCASENLSLEEYISRLRESGGYTAALDGINYSVVYETPENNIIYVTDGPDYYVSSDNTGGYVITAWE